MKHIMSNRLSTTYVFFCAGFFFVQLQQFAMTLTPVNKRKSCEISMCSEYRHIRLRFKLWTLRSISLHYVQGSRNHPCR